MKCSEITVVPASIHLRVCAYVGRCAVAAARTVRGDGRRGGPNELACRGKPRLCRGKDTLEVSPYCFGATRW